MGLLSDLANGASGAPKWQDLFKWRCPRCREIGSSAAGFPGPGEEDEWFESHGALKCTCGYTYGIDPQRVYHRCTRHLEWWGRGYVPSRENGSIDEHGILFCTVCNCRQKAKLEPAVQPLYFEKAKRSGTMLATQRPSGVSNSPSRVTYRRIVQTGSSTFAEELIIDF